MTTDQHTREQSIDAALTRFKADEDLRIQITDLERLRDLHARSACTSLLMGDTDLALSSARQVEAHDRVIDNLQAQRRAL